MKKRFLPLLFAAVVIASCGHKSPPAETQTVDSTAVIKKIDTPVVVKTDTLPKPKPRKVKVKKDTTAGALPYKTKYNQNYGLDGKPLYK